MIHTPYSHAYTYTSGLARRLQIGLVLTRQSQLCDRFGGEDAKGFSQCG